MKCPKCNVEINDYCIKCGFYNHNIDINIPKRKNVNLKWLFPTLLIILIISIISSFFIKDYIKRSYITPVEELVLDKTSESYINDLYISDEHTYKYLLDDDEKKLYRTFLNKIKNYEKSMTLDLSEMGFKYSYFSSDYFITVNKAIFMDHPELIHFAYISYKEIDKHKYKINFTYVLNEQEYKDAINEIKSILKDIKNKTKTLSDYEKVKYVYEWIGKNNKYNHASPAISQSAYSAFNENLSPVCSGYARASQIIFQNIGINSLLIEGKLKGINHEWNFVKLDNQYYYYDVTTSSTSNKPVINGISYAGFLFKDHSGYSIHNKKVVPMALGKKYIFKEK